MDKFITEQLELIKSYAEDLQSCFIDEDAYSRTPNAAEWRRAGRIVRQITLACCELSGYANARRCIEATFTRERLQIFQNEKTPSENPTANVSENGILEFTQEDILKMPKLIRKLFKTHGLKAHVRITKDGLYQIRCRAKGLDLQATSKTLKEAKQKFIAKLYKQAPDWDERKQIPKTSAVLLQPFTEEWLEHVKRPYIKEGTYGDYERTLRIYAYPKLGQTPIRNIKPLDVQKFLNEITESRAAEKCYKLLKSIFEYAVDSGVIVRNPLRLVAKPIHIQKHGSALTKDEESRLLSALEGNKYKTTFICYLYLGCRRCELKTAIFEEDFVSVITAKKRKGRPEERRRIPITPMLRKYLPFSEDLPKLRDDSMSDLFKNFCPNHHLHDLRHTFITRCQECGVPREVVSVWAGHKADETMTSNVYTHFSDEFMKEQALKVLY